MEHALNEILNFYVQLLVDTNSQWANHKAAAECIYLDFAEFKL